MTPDTPFWTLVVIIVGHTVFERWLDWLNERHWSDEVPEGLEDYFDAEQMKRSLHYHRDKKRLQALSSSLSLLAILLLLFLDGFAWLDQRVAAWSTDPVVRPVLFFGVLMGASEIISLPFSIYDTFVIEERYGFNKSTPGTFVGDRIKGWVLGIVLGGGLFALLIQIYLWSGPDFWLVAWAVLGGFTLFMAVFYTRLILPLFNKMEPLGEGELRSSIRSFCEKVNFPLSDLYVMDGSKRSSEANAFFSGLGNKKRIVLFDTLIEKHSVREVVAVLAHEIGHFKKKHTRSSVIISLAHMGLMLYLFSWAVEAPLLSKALGVEDARFHIGLLGFSILYSPVSTLLGIGMNYMSRKNEYEADRYAKEHYEGEALATALKRLSSDHLANLHPHPYAVFVHYSHPPILDRLRALDDPALQKVEA
jgi:STE24 endopeptidase